MTQTRAMQALEAFERIWKNEATGGDYQLVVSAINGNASEDTVKTKQKYHRGYYKGVTKYKRIIVEAEALLREAVQFVDEPLLKKCIRFIERNNHV